MGDMGLMLRPERRCWVLIQRIEKDMDCKETVNVVLCLNTFLNNIYLVFVVLVSGLGIQKAQSVTLIHGAWTIESR